MTNFETIIAQTAALHEQRIEKHPLLQLVGGGKMKREHYISYLCQTYHMVRHTPRMLALAGARLDETRRDLRNWFFEQVEEENNHDVFCARDLSALGEDPDRLLAQPPEQGSWALVSQNYYMATYGNPVGILGVASLTEGLGATTGSLMATILVEHYGLAKNQVTFIRSHAGFDAKHIEDVKRAIDTMVSSPDDMAAVLQGRKMAIHFYAQMFDDVLHAA